MAGTLTGIFCLKMQVSLGKLRLNECFGELAVLIQEAGGRPFPRKRSAYAASPCVLFSLSFSAMQELRRSSVNIDAAVTGAIEVRGAPALDKL